MNPRDTDTVVRETLRQDVRSVLRELPDDAMLFITSDHGFIPVPDPTFSVPNDVLTDSGDVKYQVGRPVVETTGRKGTPRTVCCSRLATWGIPGQDRQSEVVLQPCQLLPRPGLTRL